MSQQRAISSQSMPWSARGSQSRSPSDEVAEVASRGSALVSKGPRTIAMARRSLCVGLGGECKLRLEGLREALISTSIPAETAVGNVPF
eukprot:3618968-Prymnesium_polylepis.1